MLKRIPNILSPELLYLIAQMGHGDELVIADANFPAVTNAKRLVRADGYSVPAILEAILQLFPLDSYVDKPAAVMRRVDKPGEPVPIWNEYQRLHDSAEGRHIAIEQVERFAFYERAKQTFGVVATGEGALSGNIIIKKGVILPVSRTACRAAWIRSSLMQTAVSSHATCTTHDAWLASPGRDWVFIVPLSPGACTR